MDNEKFVLRGESICAIGLIIGFFLPWVDLGFFTVSGYQAPKILKEIGGFSNIVGQKTDPRITIAYIMLYLIPTFGVITIIANITNRSSKIPAFIAGAIPFAGCLYLISSGGGQVIKEAGTDIFKMIAVGLYITFFSAFGSIFFSFKKSYRLVSSPLKRENKINSDDIIDFNASPFRSHVVGPSIKFDQEKWNALLKYDADIASLADKIRPYGQKWSDEFAASYLALNDKKYLADIEQKIISTAKKEIEYKEQQELAFAKTEAERREKARIRDEEHRKKLLKEEEHRAQIRRERAKFWQDWFSRNKKIITISGFSIVFLTSIVTFLWYRNLKLEEKKIRLAKETAENLAQKFVKENIITCNNSSYIKINNVIAKISQDIHIAVHEADENWNSASFEVWSSGDDLQYEGDRGWVKNDLLLFGMIQKYGQWIQKDIKKISCSDIQEIIASKDPPLPPPLPPPPPKQNLNDSVNQNLANTVVTSPSEDSYKLLPNNNNPWIFEDSDKRYLTDNEIQNLTNDDLWKARNEIYAKKGYIFNTDRGRQYVQSLGSFYSGIETDVNKIYRRLNTYEKYNVKLIQKYEK